MIKAKLTDGTIIELVKDCECIHHSGPHWLHANDLDKVQSKRLLDAGNILGHINNELARLADKEYQMVSRGIEEIIR